MTKFHEEWAKNKDFLLMVHFKACAVFIESVSTPCIKFQTLFDVIVLILSAFTYPVGKLFESSAKLESV